ncbi:hypothetical protein BBF96_08565 [Anoxybacter fermentans]|uniref:Rubrerythrin diiron-binding domain-containing protein n=1 Tax=Anoxybacter fermentans TaxID=1323375 RepID=A0A3S9SYP9_9FIRM|nr:ferritin-like domain-containing protein [Anoxybacter fermentans]AZR73429.1 hypothetical protein BBF96_08565 [Anoxybacter fermentans]
MHYYPGPYPYMYDKSLKKTLELIRRAVADETRDRKFYEYLINQAPNEKEKNIIASIRDDEMKHFRMFREIYHDITGHYPVPLDKEEFEKPASYLDGIEKALFDELETVEMYRQIYFGLRTRKHRDMLFEIITDELKHASKFNYLYTRNL